MKSLNFTLTLLTILFLTIFTALTINAQSNRLFTVNDTGDSVDAEPGDGLCRDSNGKCTLRAAIEESNVCCTLNIINFALPAGSVINLTLGELSITSLVNIIGPGARRLTVQRSTAAGTPNFRIFHLQAENDLPSMIRGLTIKNGSVPGDGGGLYINYQVRLRLLETTVTGNTAQGSAGGIFCAGTLQMTRSLVSSNTANGFYAGGVVNLTYGQNSIITDSTLTNNTGGQGGAIFNSGNLTLVNNTISHNTARDAGSSVVNGAGGTTYVLNTIIGMDNTSVSSLQGNFISLGNNLVTDARNAAGFVNGVNNDQVSLNNTINPLLGNLTDNGGQTDTRALLASSPAINSGSNCVRSGGCPAPIETEFRLFSDQRTGYSRLSGGTVDIGAYETGSSIFGGSAGLGLIAFNSRLYGAIATLTRASDNVKQYSIGNTLGNFSFRNLDLNEVSIIEIRSKRAGLGSLFVLDNDFVPVLPFLTEQTFEQGNFKLKWTK